MNTRNAPSPRRLQQTSAKGLLFSAVVVGGLVFPSGLGGYAGQYIWIVAGAILLLVTQRLKLRPEVLVLAGVLVAVGLVSAILAPELRQAREYVRVTLFLYLLLVVDGSTRRTVFVTVAAATGVLLTFDFVALYLFDLEALKALVYQRGMQDYLGHYWRHVGLLGNPNRSAALYALVVVGSTAVVLSGRVRRSSWNSSWKILLWYCLVLSTGLMLLTLSRTAMLATLAALLAMVIVRIGRARQMAIGLAFGAVIAALWLMDAWGIQARFGSVSSFSERVVLWRSVFESITLGGLIYGGWANIPVVDNDPLYFLHNFGLLGAIVNYLVVLMVMARLWMVGFRALAAGLLTLTLLLGAGMGFQADPKFALLIFASFALIPNPAKNVGSPPREARPNEATLGPGRRQERR